MEPLFYNKRTMTPEHARMVYHQIAKKHHIMYLILEILYLITNIYYICYYGLNIILALLFILLVIIHITRPYAYAKRRIREYNALHNATEEDELFFYDDYLLSRDINTKSELKIEYDRIIKVKSTKKLYVFHIKDSQTKLITDKNMTAQGTDENFENFIKSKVSAFK